MHHTTHVNESYHTCECITPHSCDAAHHTCDCITQHMWMHHTTHVNASHHTCECITPHVWVNHTTYVNASHHTWECITPHSCDASHHTCECITQHMVVVCDAFMCVVWCITRVWCDAFTCVVWCIHMCGVMHHTRTMHAYVCRDLDSHTVEHDGFIQRVTANVNASHHTNDCVTSTYENFMTHIWMRHVTHTYVSPRKHDCATSRHTHDLRHATHATASRMNTPWHKAAKMSWHNAR